jgi:uncharacterized membrane protein
MALQAGVVGGLMYALSDEIARDKQNPLGVAFILVCVVAFVTAVCFRLWEKLLSAFSRKPIAQELRNQSPVLRTPTLHRRQPPETITQRRVDKQIR